MIDLVLEEQMFRCVLPSCSCQQLVGVWSLLVWSEAGADDPDSDP